MKNKYRKKIKKISKKPKHTPMQIHKNNLHKTTKIWATIYLKMNFDVKTNISMHENKWKQKPNKYKSPGKH